MNSKQETFYIFSAFIILLLLMLGTVYFISKLSIKKEQGFIIQEKQVINCNSKLDCDDKTQCTIDSCQNSECLNTPIVLCYNNDDCCPSSCNLGNDNDCK